MSEAPTPPPTGGKKAKKRPILHVALYGDPGSLKSTMAATFPAPMLVTFFDGLGKDGPYLRHAKREGWKAAAGEGEEGQLVRTWADSEGRAKLQLEYFTDMDPSSPWACDAYHRRMQRFVREREFEGWKTLVLDSASGLVDTSMNQQQGINPGSDEEKGLRWVAGSTTQVERFLVRTLPYLPCNVVTLYHIQHEKSVVKVGRSERGMPTHPLQKGMAEWQDTYRRSLALPGRLSKSNAIFRQYAECYRLWVGDDGKVRVQTQASDEYVACTQIGAPDGCGPNYKELWGAK